MEFLNHMVIYESEKVFLDRHINSAEVISTEMPTVCEFEVTVALIVKATRNLYLDLFQFELYFPNDCWFLLLTKMKTVVSEKIIFQHFIIKT